MLRPEQVAKFQAEGFLLGNKVLSDEQVGVLQDELDRVIRDNGKPGIPQPVRIMDIAGQSGSPVWQIVNIWQASDAYRELIFNPTVIEEVAQLTGAKQLRIWHDQIQYKPKETGGVNMWHQDSPYWPTLKPKDVMVTAWIALDDVDAGNGCMRMIPGTHKWGDRIDFIHTIKDFYNPPAEYNGNKLEVRYCPVPQGHVHFHHALTWHGSGENKSGRPRRAIALHYMTERCLYDASGGHPMKPFIHVADGEMLQGEAFPLVWEAREPAAV